MTVFAMNESRSSEPELSNTQIGTAIRKAIAATEEGDYEDALRIFSAIYGTAQARVPTGLSYYGLCLAKVDKKFNLAIKSCEKAIQLQFYEAAHYLNLIDVYLMAGSRKKAVQTLEAAMARLPNDAEILAKREKMGYRNAPVFSSFHRDNFLNVFFGKLRSRMRRTRPMSTMVKIIIAAAVFAGGFGGMLWFLFNSL